MTDLFNSNCVYVSKQSEMGIRFYRVGVTEVFDLGEVGAGNQTKVFYKSRKQGFSF